MRKRKIIALVAALLCGLLLVITALASTTQNYDFSWWTVDGGGGASSGGGYGLIGTIGQPDTRRMSGGAFNLTGGLWSGGAALVAINSPPVAEDDTVPIDEEAIASGVIVASDPDVGDPLSYAITSAPLVGVAEVDPSSGAWVYTPTNRISPHIDSFIVTVTDGVGNTDTARVELVVSADNDPPAADDVLVSTDEDVVASGVITAADPDTDDILTYTITSAPLEGAAHVDMSSGAWVFTPTNRPAPYVAIFLVTVADGGANTDIAQVTVDVSADDDPPTADAGPDQPYAPINWLIALDGSGSSDPEGEPLTYLWAQTGGSPSVLLSSATVSQPTFTAPETFTILTFTLNVSDPASNADTAQVTVNVTRLKPNCPTSLSGVSISGPTAGYTGSLYAFTTIVTPASATPPITYTWSPVPTFGQAEANAAYRWKASGVHTLTLEARNCGWIVTDTHTIDLSEMPLVGDGYEIDDTCAQAQPILTDGSIQLHSFHTTGDGDWASFQVVSGTEYLVEAITPADSRADVALEVYDDCDDHDPDFHDITFSPDIRLSFTAPHSGTLYLRHSNSVPETAGPDVTYHLSVRDTSRPATVGALVLIAGRRRLDDTLQPNIHNVTNAVYNLFLAHGYDESRIHYLATNDSLDPDGDGSSEINAMASRTNLESAITQWAAGEELGLGPERAFTLYLMDHGGQDLFCLNGSSETVSPAELDQWLGELEAAAPGVRVNVIMEACHSGSFLDSLGKQGRVVIASTADQAVAYASQIGAVFSDTFLEALGRGLSLYNSFEEARWDARTAHPDQTSWLDDDGDGQPNEIDDGPEAARRGFAYAGTFAEQWPPYIVWARVRDVQDGEGIIEASVLDDQQVTYVQAVVYAPSYKPPDPGETEEMVQEILPIAGMTESGVGGVWSGLYQNFDETGMYRLVIYAADNEELKARPKAVRVLVGMDWSVYLPVALRND